MTGLEVGITPWDGFERGGAGALCAQAERAESLGFHSFWLPEGHFSGAAAIPQPLLWHAAIAARTERLRLGTTSYLLPIRHPLQVAEEVAVLDRLSGGRVILGVGRGFRKALFDAFDVDRSTKRDRFEAALAVMRDAWAGYPVTPESETPGAPSVLAPRPVQDPHPPIWVAAFGPKALEQAGRLGLPYLASPIESEAALTANYAMHRETLAQHGHDAASLAVPIMRTVFAHPDAAVVSRVRDALQRQALALGSSASAVLRRSGAAEAEDFAILGEPTRVRDEVLRYREKLGMTHLIARTQVPGADAPERIAALEALASVDLAA
ncbi:MAG TPA: LLM class flavin-dependent oxidoreductase [Myxococcota bacterium]|nr:LLM class flavin-dependent oxidoreductase [Myxococcota bacterium]